jgi:hypothetical protein
MGAGGHRAEPRAMEIVGIICGVLLVFSIGGTIITVQRDGYRRER